MTDTQTKVAEAVVKPDDLVWLREHYLSWVADLLEALAADLTAATDRAEKVEAERDRLAAELAEARTLQGAARVLLDHAMKTCGTEEPDWDPVFAAMEPFVAGRSRIPAMNALIAALRALAKGETK